MPRKVLCATPTARLALMHRHGKSIVAKRRRCAAKWQTLYGRFDRCRLAASRRHHRATSCGVFSRAFALLGNLFARFQLSTTSYASFSVSLNRVAWDRAVSSSSDSNKTEQMLFSHDRACTTLNRGSIPNSHGPTATDLGFRQKRGLPVGCVEREAAVDMASAEMVSV